MRVCESRGMFECVSGCVHESNIVRVDRKRKIEREIEGWGERERERDERRGRERV